MWLKIISVIGLSILWADSKQKILDSCESHLRKKYLSEVDGKIQVQELKIKYHDFDNSVCSFRVGRKLKKDDKIYDQTLVGEAKTRLKVSPDGKAYWSVDDELLSGEQLTRSALEEIKTRGEYRFNTSNQKKQDLNDKDWTEIRTSVARRLKLCELGKESKDPLDYKRKSHLEFDFRTLQTLKSGEQLQRAIFLLPDEIWGQVKGAKEFQRVNCPDTSRTFCIGPILSRLPKKERPICQGRDF